MLVLVVVEQALQEYQQELGTNHSAEYAWGLVIIFLRRQGTTFFGIVRVLGAAIPA